ncbi:MAG: polysaccharide deacetylase family protein [Dehalococcoidales bacterium]|nr:polysaccharide deacetylase family protein [Dehalococcoidales bacterium]
MINNKMKISVIIPARNEARLIAGTLRSLQNQSYQGDYEIVVVDNGSRDATAEIARSFGVRVVSAGEQKSVFYARQVGADATDGDIIVQADGDTLYPEHWLQQIADKFRDNPEAVAVSGRFLYRDFFLWSFIELTVRDWLNRISAFFFKRPFLVSGATFAFRRWAFNKVGGYRNIPYSADQHGMTTRLRKLGDVLYDPKIYCLTSSRSVQQPWFVLLMAITDNISRLMLDFSINLVSSKPKAAVPTLRKRMALSISAVLALFIAFAAYGYFSPTSPVFGEVRFRGSPDQKCVALTFDDGPNGIYTMQILDILKEYDIKATFFVIGQNVELYPDITKRILAEGHVIGNHTNTHDANHALSDQGCHDLKDAQEVIYRVAGVLPHLYRPPHGKKTPWELDCVEENSLIEITWGVAANDRLNPGTDLDKAAQAYADKIVSRTYPGAVILLHDGYGTEHDNANADRTFTVKALPLIIEQLLAKGYRFVTVSEMFNVPAYNEAG